MKNHALLSLAVVLANFLNVGCAAIATKGSLPVVADLPIGKSKPTLIYRYYKRTPWNGGGGVNFGYSKDEDNHLLSVLEKSGLYSQVTSYPKKMSPTLQLVGSDVSKEEALALEVNFPVGADLFMDVEDVGKDHGPHAYMHWGLLHFVTLGLIPIAVDNDVQLKITLYDRLGKLLRKDEIKDESTIWGWTPLFFFNGFKLFRSQESLVEPLKENSVRYLLKREQETLDGH